MKGDDLEARMRELEYFHGIRLLPGAWAIVRFDGRGFTRFTGERFEKPFDAAFRDLMAVTAEALVKELLFQHGINFAHLPAWQRRGVGLYWEEYAKKGYNPKEQREVVATRRRVKGDDELPMREEYGVWLREGMRAARTR